jgi:arylsulfatase A-like enzyme
VVEEESAIPFFMWVHLYDPHAPYDPPPPYDKRFANLYDGEIADADACLGKLFDYLRQRGLYDRALIEVMSDHGESLGAHGESMHGIFLYDETIRVPLVFKLPGELLARRRVSSRVRPRGRCSYPPEHAEFAFAAHIPGRVAGAVDEG